MLHQLYSATKNITRNASAINQATVEIVMIFMIALTEAMMHYCKSIPMGSQRRHKMDKSLRLQGRRRRSGWSGLSRTNNLELNQLADQLELHYYHAIFGRSHLHVATYILQMLLKMHDTSSYLVSQPN